MAGAMGDLADYRGYRDAQPADAGPPPHHLLVERDAIQHDSVSMNGFGGHFTFNLYGIRL